ncbi:MAG: glycosyltransferase family 4 protein [Paraprevotella sp.]|nr:glycosyltransferase family 4 protein [Paraprevotella sp.]
MRILFILPYVPYPLNSGGNQATFNMLDCIRKEHEVSIVTYVKTEEAEQGMHALRKIWPDVDFYPFINPHLTSRLHEDQDELENMPRTFAYRFFDAIRRSMERKIDRRIKRYRWLQSQGMVKSVERKDFVRLHSCLFQSMPGTVFPIDFHDFVYETARRGFDLIQVEFYECLPLVHLLPEKAVKVFVQHEIRYVRNRNELDLFQEVKPNDLLLFNLLKDVEQKALSHYDKIIALTETDRQIMQADIPTADVYVSPAAVAAPKTDPLFQPGKDLIFIGNGAHFPNADGLVWFSKEVMPVLNRKGVETKVYIVGVWNEEIQQKIKGLAHEVEFTGFVDDLQGFANGKVSIVPIRIGSGMRMKILDSIFAASPVVTTSKGSEGLPLTDREDCLIADTPEDFASAIAQLLNRQDLQKQLADRSLDKFKDMFNTSDMQKRRMELYARIEKDILRNTPRK